MNQPNKSLREKSAARLAAAQMLYASTVNGAPPDAERMIAEYEDFKEGDINLPYLKKLLEGVAEHGAHLEPWVDNTLTGNWKKERMSPLLLAILRLAAFELAHFPQLSASIIVNEYTTLAARFFNESETGFINAALSAMAAEVRS